MNGSAPVYERLGDVRAQEVLHTYNVIIRQQIAAHQGFEVKSEGDGFMLAFSSARRALECAIAIQQTLAAHNAENADEPIKVRIGLHTGEAIKEGDDFFGKSVILAARIASQPWLRATSQVPWRRFRKAVISSFPSPFFWPAS